MIEILASTLRLSTPLIFASMGGLLCERSGIATICLEGVLLISAWTSATVAYATGSPSLAVAAGIISGSLFMAMHGLLTIVIRADAIISGLVVNLFAMGLTPVLTKIFFDSPTNTPSLNLSERLLPTPVAEGPGVIAYFLHSIFSQSILVYFSWGTPIFLFFILQHSRWGVRLIAAGENPKVLETCGVNYFWVRWQAILWGGAITSLGGVFLSISQSSQFTRGMTAGRGFIALTAVIFGKWRPIPTFFACLLFGLADAFQIHLQSMRFGDSTFPVQFIQALPYIITLVVLVLFVGKSQAPLAIGAK